MIYSKLMKAAVALEDQTNFPAGPPNITQPSFEQYGEWLLTKGNYKEAIEQFDKALQRMPKRSKSLIGKMTALKGLDRKDEAALVERDLQSIMAEADDGVLKVVSL